MAVLFLRGEQTPGELKQRTERMQAVRRASKGCRTASRA